MNYLHFRHAFLPTFRVQCHKFVLSSERWRNNAELAQELLSVIHTTAHKAFSQSGLVLCGGTNDKFLGAPWNVMFETTKLWKGRNNAKLALPFANWHKMLVSLPESYFKKTILILFGGTEDKFLCAPWNGFKWNWQI